MTRKVLIVGITGQDGAYLAHHLLNKGYQVIGSSRDSSCADSSRLERLGILKHLEIVSLQPADYSSVLCTLKDVKPNHIYNLAGQTSVGLSYCQPFEAMESISNSVLNFLEAIKITDKSIKFFNAGSSETFGNVKDFQANESTQLKPRSPYAIAKATAFWQVASYRDSYGLFASTGILANHESPLRHSRFVTQKIISTAKLIKAGSMSEITLGNLNVWRDWGWAPDYVNAISLMMEHDYPEDFVIATGKTTSLKEFTQKVFNVFELDFNEYLRLDNSKLRPSDIEYSSLDPSLIQTKLGWKSSIEVDDIIVKMINGELF